MDQQARQRHRDEPEFDERHGLSRRAIYRRCSETVQAKVTIEHVEVVFSIAEEDFTAHLPKG